MLTVLGKGQGYFKAGLLGFNKSGKTYTAAILAIGIRKFFSLSGPVAMFDTEGGSEYIAALIQRETTTDFVGVRARSLQEMLETGKECEREGISVYIVDSITHPWRELMNSYLTEVNSQRAGRKLPPRTRLEFQDWGAIKNTWAPWTDFFLNSKLHIIVCGRAGDIYEYQENEETERRELIKTGVKMKTETEFGFEPSLLIEMERIQKVGEKTALIHRATVIGDRFGVIDGESADNPTFEFFLPHIERLKPGAYAPVDTKNKTPIGIDDSGDIDWVQEKKQRAILCEEIQGLMVEKWPGQTAQEKSEKLALLERIFQTRSWTRVENTNSSVLREGLEKVRSELRPSPTVQEQNGAFIHQLQQGFEAANQEKAASQSGLALISTKQQAAVKQIAARKGFTEEGLLHWLFAEKKIDGGVANIPKSRMNEICDDLLKWEEKQ